VRPDVFWIWISGFILNLHLGNDRGRSFVT